MARAPAISQRRKAVANRISPTSAVVFPRQTTQEDTFEFLFPCWKSLALVYCLNALYPVEEYVWSLLASITIPPPSLLSSPLPPTMPPYSSSQKQLLAQFMSFTETKDSTAAKVLPIHRLALPVNESDIARERETDLRNSAGADTWVI